LAGLFANRLVIHSWVAVAVLCLGAFLHGHSGNPALPDLLVNGGWIVVAALRRSRISRIATTLAMGAAAWGFGLAPREALLFTLIASAGMYLSCWLLKLRGADRDRRDALALAVALPFCGASMIAATLAVDIPCSNHDLATLLASLTAVGVPLSLVQRRELQRNLANQRHGVLWSLALAAAITALTPGRLFQPDMMWLALIPVLVQIGLLILSGYATALLTIALITVPWLYFPDRRNLAVIEPLQLSIYLGQVLLVLTTILLHRDILRRRRLAMSTFERAALAMARINSHGQIIEVNRQMRLLAAQPEEQLLGRNIVSLIHQGGDGAPRPWTPPPPSTADGAAATTAEVMLLQGGGRQCPCWLTANWVRLDVRERPFLLLALKDISERKAMEQHIASQRALLDTLQEAIPDAVWVKDPEGRYRYVNGQMCRVLQQRPEQLIGASENMLAIDPSLQHLYQAMEDQILQDGQQRQFEEAAVGPDGVLRWFNVIKQRIEIDADGGFGVLGVARDISPQREAEQALIQREQLLSKLAAQVPGALFCARVEQHQHIVELEDPGNRLGELFGVDSSWLLSNQARVWHRVDAADRSGLQRALRRAARRRHTCRYEFRITLADGDCRWIELVAMPERQSDATIRWYGFMHEVTARRHGDERARLLASVFAQCPESIVLSDAQFRITEVNPTFEAASGYLADEVLGRQIALLLPDEYDLDCRTGMRDQLQSIGNWIGELSLRRKGGNTVQGALNASGVYDRCGRLTHYVYLFSDLTELMDQRARLERMAHFDALTGLPNRVLLAERLQQAMARSHRRRTQLAVAYLDLDGFKAVNDSYGHDMGDRLLIAVSQRLRETLREVDTVARLGGDEFVLLMEDFQHRDAVDILLQRVLEALADPVPLQGLARAEIGGSIGVSLYPQDEVDADTLLRQADQAMYQAKQSGRNCICYFNAESHGAEDAVATPRPQLRA